MTLTVEAKQQLCQSCKHIRNHFCTKHGDEWKRITKRRATCEGWGNALKPATDHAGELAVVACYFNPCGYESIRDNYFQFREQLTGADLFTIELSFTGEFVIPDALQITGGPENVMWQKERLLNILVESLPEKYTSVAWIDADVIFLDSTWADQAKAMLRELPVVQLFQTVELTDSTGSVFETHPGEVYQKLDKIDSRSYKSGYAWAARRELFPLYDKNILGGADSYMMHAWLDSPDASFKRITRKHLQAFREWSQSQAERVQRQLGYLPITIRHLWHGTRENRRYVERSRYLTDHDFDPATDIKLDENGLWKWCSGKPAMHRKVAGYFAERNDDEPTPRKYPPIKHLAIVACHFNPCGYRAPLENCRRFLNEIGHPVILVELSFDGNFQFDHAIQIQGNDQNRMWQKERLINIGIQSLPDDVDAVAWIDADLLFRNPDWYEQAKRLLEQHQVIQLYEGIDYLEPDKTVKRSANSYANNQRLNLDEYSTPGGAWAARRDAIPDGIYDGDIVGGADALFIASVTKQTAYLEKYYNGLKHITDSFTDYRQRQIERIDSNIGMVPGRIVHLWHGTRANRNYHTRLELLRQHDFRSTDIRINENGLWEWCTDKPGLHSGVADYFVSRREDSPV